MSVMLLRVGFMADGIWKALVGISMLVFFPFLVDELRAPGLLLGVTSIAVLASAIAELAYAARSGARSHVKHLIAYDSAWVLVSVAALTVAASNADLAWMLWLGYQVVAAPVVALVFGAGARKGGRSASASRPRRR